MQYESIFNLKGFTLTIKTQAIKSIQKTKNIDPAGESGIAKNKPNFININTEYNGKKLYYPGVPL